MVRIANNKWENIYIAHKCRAKLIIFGDHFLALLSTFLLFLSWASNINLKFFASGISHSIILYKSSESALVSVTPFFNSYIYVIYMLLLQNNVKFVINNVQSSVCTNI